MRRKKLLSVFSAMMLTAASMAGCSNKDAKETTAAVEETQETSTNAPATSAPTTSAPTTSAPTTSAPATTEATQAQPTEESTEMQTPEDTSEANVNEAKEAIRHDDNIIWDIERTCIAALADEKYYSVAEDIVRVNIIVSNKKASISVDGFSQGANDYVEEVLRAVTESEDGVIEFLSDAYEGSTTEIAFEWDARVYCWASSIQNSVEGSEYYKDLSVPITQDPAEAKTTIHVMCFTTEVKRIIERYARNHPKFDAKYDLSFTVVSTADDAYTKALDSALASEGEAPDLYVANVDFVKKYTTGSASDYACTYEALGIDVEQGIRDGGIASYIGDVTRRDGQVVALGYDGNGCAFIYNREVARDVFGDDNPETVEAALGVDWDSFFEAAEKCKARGFAIVSGDDAIWRAVENSADHGWVVDGKLYIDPKRKAFLNIAKKLKDNEYTNDTIEWTEGWFADMAEVGAKRVLGFYGPSWFVANTMQLNCGYSGRNETGTWGQWGVCRPNVYSFWDGTWVIANKKALADESLKAGVRELIEYMTLDTSTSGLQYEFANGYDEYSIAKQAVASSVVMGVSSNPDEFLDGQDAFPVFMMATVCARGDNLTEYDSQINLYWREAVRSYTNGEFSYEEAINWFKSAIRENIPEIVVE